MNEIADDYYNELINGEHKIDVLLGGGKSNFERSDVNLTKSFKKDGFSYVTANKDRFSGLLDHTDHAQIIVDILYVGKEK